MYLPVMDQLPNYRYCYVSQGILEVLALIMIVLAPIIILIEAYILEPVLGHHVPSLWMVIGVMVISELFFISWIILERYFLYKHTIKGLSDYVYKITFNYYINIINDFLIKKRICLAYGFDDVFLEDKSYKIFSDVLVKINKSGKEIRQAYPNKLVFDEVIALKSGFKVRLTKIDNNNDRDVIGVEILAIRRLGMWIYP